jgi:hypothetical protein
MAMPASLPNLNLTRYWRRKRAALDAFLKLPPKDASAGKADTDTLTGWFNGMVGPNTQSSLEAKLDAALKDVRDALTPVSGTPGHRERRSARLVRLVQRAVGAGPDGSRYYMGVADANYAQAGQANLENKVRSAAVAAADFISAARNNIGGAGGGLTRVWAALNALIGQNGDIDQVMLDELTGLAEAMREALPRAGSGDGSAFWPSTFVGSSSSSSGGG